MPTITFSEYSIGTVNPIYTFTDTVVRTTGVIVSDGAQPASPVIAANSSYTGPVFVYFDTPVTTVTLDVGYFNNLGSTRIEFRDQFGRIVQSYHNTDMGVLTFGCDHPAGIASIAIIDEAFDAAGFSVDTIMFGPVAAELPAPTVARVSAAASVDRAFGTVQGGTTLTFSDAVGDTDSQDFITLNVSAATTARVRIFLNGDPDNVREVTVNLVAGNNILRILADDSYGDLEGYTMVVQVADFADPDAQFINDTLKDILGSVLDYKKLQSEVFQHILTLGDDVDEAAALMGKMAKAFSILGYTIDVANRIDNIRSASDWKKQLAIEMGDFVLNFATTSGVGVGVSFVGTPIAGAVAGFAANLVYTYGLSSYVRTELGDAYETYINTHNVDGTLIAGATADGTVLGDAGADALDGADPDFSNLVFDEAWYLATYADAAAAVASGAAVSGLAYYLSTGIGLGHAINAGGTVVDPADVADGLDINDPGSLMDQYLDTRVLGTRAGDLLNAGEVALSDFINDDIRTASTELALNGNLSALANRIAQDWMLNHQGTIEEAMLDGGAGWAETLSNGETFQVFLADLAAAAGIDLSQTSLLVSWNGGDTPEEVYASLVTTIGASQLLVGLESESIGVAQVGGLWVILISTQSLADDGIATDASVQHAAGDDYGNDLLGGEGMDLIDGNGGYDHVWGRGGNDTLSGEVGNDTLEGGAGADSLLGGAGNDTLIGDGFANAPAVDPGAVLTDITLGGTGLQVIAQAMVNDVGAPIALDTMWSIAADPNIVDATTHPHLTLEITASGERYESFSFTARAGQTFVFDIDGVSDAGTNVDSYLELRNADGTIIAYDDDSSTTDGAGGSTSGYDPYLSYTFSTDGIYTINLRRFGTSNFTAGTTARLAISLDTLHDAPPPPPPSGAHADTLLGGLGNDWISGEAGSDSLRGGDGADTVLGGEGDDTIFGGDTTADLRDVIYGGDGNDTIDGGYGNDELRGDDGNDAIEGYFGSDTIIGGTGNDTISGSALSDQLFGGDNNDFLNGGFGHDRMNGGAGADRFYHLGIANHGSDWVQDYNGAEDTLVFGNASATRSQFQINYGTTVGAGDAAVQEAFVVYRPTGQVIWALVDGAGQDHIWLQIGAASYDLMA